jgi:hypothetical protein
MGNDAGKLLIAAGAVLMFAGLLVYFRDSLPLIKHLGRLPGDIHVRKENFSFYFPLATCIVLSVLLTIIFRIIGRMR